MNCSIWPVAIAARSFPESCRLPRTRDKSPGTSASVSKSSGDSMNSTMASFARAISATDSLTAASIPSLRNCPSAPLSCDRESLPPRLCTASSTATSKSATAISAASSMSLAPVAISQSCAFSNAIAVSNRSIPSMSSILPRACSSSAIGNRLPGSLRVPRVNISSLSLTRSISSDAVTETVCSSSSLQPARPSSPPALSRAPPSNWSRL